MGLEPTTPCLQSRCSSQLSYVPEEAISVAVPSTGSARSSTTRRGAVGTVDASLEPRATPGRPRMHSTIGTVRGRAAIALAIAMCGLGLVVAHAADAASAPKEPIERTVYGTTDPLN